MQSESDAVDIAVNADASSIEARDETASVCTKMTTLDGLKSVKVIWSCESQMLTVWMALQDMWIVSTSDDKMMNSAPDRSFPVSYC